MTKQVKKTKLERNKTTSMPTIVLKGVKKASSQVHEPEPGDYASGLTEENKNQRLELRLTKLQKEVIGRASHVSGFKNISDYILHLAIADSRNIIREQQLFELSERDRVSFMETLNHPPKPGKNLKKALANYLSFNEGE